MFKKYISIICVLLIIHLTSCILGPGTAPDAEYYNLNIDEAELICRIDSFKNEHPKYKFIQILPDGETKEFKDHYPNTIYYSYFYFNDINKVMRCVIKGGRIGLYGISDPDFNNFKTINTKEISYGENKKMKKKFESEILIYLRKVWII